MNDTNKPPQTPQPAEPGRMSRGERKYWRKRALHHWDTYWTKTRPRALKANDGAGYLIRNTVISPDMIAHELQTEGCELATPDLVRDDLLREEMLPHLSRFGQ